MINVCDSEWREDEFETRYAVQDRDAADVLDVLSFEAPRTLAAIMELTFLSYPRAISALKVLEAEERVASLSCGYIRI